MYILHDLHNYNVLTCVWLVSTGPIITTYVCICCWTDIMSVKKVNFKFALA